MGTKISRRTMLGGLAAGAAVVGWSPRRGAWVTAAEAAPAGTRPVPRLDGSLVTDPATRAAFGRDFGHLVEAAPWAVLRPGSVRDIVAIVGFARRHGLTVAMNGQGGPPGITESHSSYGQATAPGGIAVDAGALAAIHRTGDAWAEVDAGVTWAELVA
ncbi:MAG TPA: FAD-binding protein, partial [Acidimicrobiales bacterium]